MPAGAVSVETELTLTVLSGDDADGAVRAVEVGPAGTVFAGPVTLEMRELPELEADEAYQLSLSVAGEWVPLPEAYEVSGAGIAGARLRHLSRYGVLKRKRENRAEDPCECSEARRTASDACCESVNATLGGATECGRACLLDPVTGPQDFSHYHSQMWGILNCWYEGIAAEYFRETAHGRCARKCCERPNGMVVGGLATWARYDGENVVCSLPRPGERDAFLRCLDACPEPEREGVPQCTCANAAETSCGGACVDLQTDRGNCGRCGVVCGARERCIAGACGGTCDCEAEWPGPCTEGNGSRRTTYTYDANGNRLSEERDVNADGTVDSRTTYTYDANGNLLSEEWDWDVDGTVDNRTTYTYDANGNLLTSTTTVGSRWTYTYDCWE